MAMITRLPHAARVLASAPSQQGQSTTRDALDGSGAGCGRGRSRVVGDDGAAHLVLDGYGQYRQRATEEACHLVTSPVRSGYPDVPGGHGSALPDI
jgi:hypothetical protein